MKTSILICATMLAAGLSAQAQQTQILTAEKYNEYGLVYRLPKTALAIEITAQRTVKTAGPFFQYANKYIGTDKIIKETTSEWSITDIKVTPYGVPDDSRKYLMQLKPGATTYIGADANGMLLSINTTPDSPEAIPATNTELTADSFDPNEYLQYVNEDFLSSQSQAKRAQMLAENIMEVRDAKISLTRGTADTMPADGRQMELMLNSLTHQEQSMTAAFTGNESTQTCTRTYYYIPAEEGTETLLRLSDFDGFTAPDDFAGEPVRIKVEVTQRAEMPKDERGEAKRMPKDAVVYRIPGRARVTLSFAGRNLYNREFEMAQYGTVFGLNPSLFTDKKSPSYAVFSPVTGAVEAIGAVSDLIVTDEIITDEDADATVAF